MALANKGFVNGPLLDALHWTAGVTTVHPSMHRLKNALGLTVGMWGGRYIGDRLVGETPDGMKVDKENAFILEEPLVGALHYDRHSDRPKDRWMHVGNMWFPMILGGVGAYVGSQMYGQQDGTVLPAAEKALAKAKTLTLEQAEYAAVGAQTHLARIMSGATAPFGSSGMLGLIPGPWSYAWNLSISFQGTVPRNKIHTPWMPALQKYINGNNHQYAFGPSSMLPRLSAYLLDNPDKDAPEARRMAHAILEPWFGQRVTEKHVDAFLKPMLEARDKAWKQGGVPQAEKEALTKVLDGCLKGAGLEKHLMKIGLNPAEAMIGRNGFVEAFARAFGSGKELERIESVYRQGLIERGVLKELPKDIAAVNAATRAADRMVQTKGNLAIAGLALGMGVLGYNAITKGNAQAKKIAEAHAKLDAAAASPPPSPEVQVDSAEQIRTSIPAPDERREEELHRKLEQSLPPKAKVAPPPHAPHDEGGLLPFMERLTDMLNAPTTFSLHRLSCALGLSIGGYIGMQVGDAIAGKTLGGKALALEGVLAPLRPLFKAYEYNTHSHAPKDRWGYVLHFAIPGIFAAAGVVAASEMFFRDRKKAVNAKGNYLDDYENRATLAEANTWTPGVAALAPAVTPTGTPFFPLVNYSTTLGTRFMMASGRKGALPGMGEWWSGSTSRYPYGPVALIDHMIQYAAHNEDRFPRQLDEMARGIVLQWFPNATPEQVAAFAHKAQRDHEKFYKEGVGIPQEMEEQAITLLAKHFKGAGLEQTLREIGLDPMQAVLGANGVAGVIAKGLGAESEIKDMTKEYHDKYAKRLERQRAAAAEAPAQQAV